mmetsp:Transcript_22629/g.20103  ORF Transcript_22629/g.20103 Transcript_22629/m.20103 type:complete len:214 (+) Transcript_22629:548-1189(+)
MLKLLGKKLQKRKNLKNVYEEEESKIDFKVNDMMIGSSSLLDSTTIQNFSDKTNLGISRASHSEYKNNGILDESSFFRMMDKLDEESELSVKKEKKLISVENQVQFKRLNLNLLNKNSSNIVMKAEEDPSLCINEIKKNLIENIKLNKLEKCRRSSKDSEELNILLTERSKGKKISTARVRVGHDGSKERALLKTKSYSRLPRGKKKNKLNNN